MESFVLRTIECIYGSNEQSASRTDAFCAKGGKTRQNEEISSQTDKIMCKTIFTFFSFGKITFKQ